MQPDIIKGKVIFIHHEKQYVTVEYELNGKKKELNGMVGDAVQQKWKSAKIIKRIHLFRMGDEVNFIIVPTAKKDKLMADCICFLYNNAFTNLLNKAAIDNQYVGYLKKVEEGFFVKETGSYIVFPLLLSPWEKPPSAVNLNEPIRFTLNHFDKPDKVTASLLRNEFIPEYLKAQECFKKKKAVYATVKKVTPYGVTVGMFNNVIEAKISVEDAGETIKNIQAEQVIKVMITYLEPQKIVVKPA